MVEFLFVVCRVGIDSFVKSNRKVMFRVLCDCSGSNVECRIRIYRGFWVYVFEIVIDF